MLQLLNRYDLSVCLVCNRACRAAAVQRTFAIVSRLGDGIFWYALMLALPVAFGGAGLMAAAHMLAVGLVGVLVYKFIKRRTGRARPYSVESAITLGCDPLDLYSFPSGHTLHAVAFTLVTVHYFPPLVWLLAPFAALVAASRVILGLHYPTDVLCGAALGAGLALGSIALLA